VIPVGRPVLGDRELEAVGEVFASRWLGTGAITEQFERAVSDHCGGRPCVATNTGTSALHLALETIGIGPGDEVILPSLTYVAAAQAVVAAGARPVLCDVDPQSLNAEVDCLRAAATERTRAVIPVHYRGLASDLDAILEWAGPLGIRVVEDAAHAFGSFLADGTPVGARGDMTCFSFDPIKSVTAGEGGCIVFNRDEEAARAARMRVLGIDTTAWARFERAQWHQDVLENGFRYHMPNFCAAIGLVQLERLEGFRRRKQAVLARYQAAFRGLSCLEMRSFEVSRCCPFLALVLLDERERFMDHMREHGVGTGVHYIPAHHFTRFRECAAGSLEVTDRLAEQICSLPLSADQTDEETEQVIDAVMAFERARTPAAAL
jgi:perosamine synthetase